MKDQACGSYRQCSDSDFLSADDFAKDTTVIITGASIEDVTAPNNKKKKMICLSFERTNKKLALNMTNGKTISKITGSTEVEKWIGQKITLYRTTIKAFGDPEMPAIRVRTKD